MCQVQLDQNTDSKKTGNKKRNMYSLILVIASLVGVFTAAIYSSTYNFSESSFLSSKNNSPRTTVIYDKNTKDSEKEISSLKRKYELLESLVYKIDRENIHLKKELNLVNKKINSLEEGK